MALSDRRTAASPASLRWSVAPLIPDATRLRRSTNGRTMASSELRSPSLPHRAFPYRPEVDGLRAVAVIPVVLFHAGFTGFGGGYIGVDIFFVISGYLITSII